MADYFTELSFEVELPSQEAAVGASQLMLEIEKWLFERDDESDASVPDGFERFKNYDISCGVVIEGEGSKLWIRDECGCPEIDFLCEYLQLVLERFDPDGAIGFEYSHTCSRHRADSFGGSAAFVTAHGTEFCHTWQWLEEQKTAHSNPGKAA